MNRLMRFLGIGIFVAAVAMALAGGHASAQAVSDNGSVRLQWHVPPIINLSITPNYQAGFGPTGGSGSGSTPSPGPSAVLKGGIVDFGSNVVQGFAYLYKYAVQASVLTNDANGFTVYAEGASNITDNTNASNPSLPINQVLYWIDSSSSNTPFSNATPFQPTSYASCGTGCINYGGSVPPATAAVWSYSSSTIGQPSNTVSQGFDYQLRLYSSPATDNFSVYVVYTAVGN